MAIRERSTSQNKTAAPADREALAEAYISNAGKPTKAQPPTEPDGEAGRTPVMVRYQRHTLKKIDAAAKRRGMTRSAWLQYAASRILELEEKE